MKILFICEPISPHAARWINQFSDSDIDVHIISEDFNSRSICADLKSGTVYLPDSHSCPEGVKLVTTNAQDLSQHVQFIIQLIDIIKPDLIHTLGMYVNGTNRCKILSMIREKIPPISRIPWVYSSWGMDLDWFAKLEDEEALVLKAASQINYHISEGDRDIKLLKKYNFQGKTLGKVPAFGGVTWSTEGLPELEDRKTILIKARDFRDGDFIGRAFSAFPALLANLELLKNYKVIAIQAGENFKYHANQLHKQYGLQIECPGRLDSHSEVLNYYRKARIWIGLTSNDGLPSSLVEAMSLGAVPIHSRLNSLEEWFIDGKHGLLLDLNHSAKLASLLRVALQDDQLCKNISSYNRTFVNENWGFAKVREQSLSFYQQVLEENQNKDT